MHIVDVAEFYAPLGGGVKTYIDAKLNFAHQNGAKVTVIAPGPEDRVEPRDGGQVIYVKAPVIPVDKRYHVFWKAAPVQQLLDELKPDVVEASSPFRGAWIVANWQGRAANRAHRALFMHADPVAAHFQVWTQGFLKAETVDRAASWYWRYLARTAGRFQSVVVGSRWFGQRIRKQADIRSDLIPLGVDKELFHPCKRDMELRRQMLAEFGLPPSARLLVGVGRHHHEKQWPVVFEAVGALRDEGVAMVQIGNGFANERVHKAAAAAGNVKLLGHVGEREKLARILASADAMIHGSRAETFGLVASEGLATGLPLILPSEGGCTDAADPAWSELYEPGNPAAATDAIHRLLTRNPDQLRVNAIGARRSHISTPAQHFERLFSLYRNSHPPVLSPMPTPVNEPTALPAAA
ncbi:glycosyltransferase [Sandaracinobacter sp. RS1-74]|uniref:glycosyltransferase n=1 Tax=Sandaracinobacteroides sayramensis TaxID=2913411 RepID=UPI001EDBCE5B|nr:glycosyltransferase [Sandaracinobacteroides sayramensis]MCG2840213.1 glycosyltransferase [Sandaracinobacteroides sayramensis]